MATAPMAAVSAAAEPEIPEKNIEATILAQARPPGSQPTRLSEKSMIRREMPPDSMIDPASIKSGTANRSKESTPAKSSCTMVWPRAATGTEGGKIPGARIRPMAGIPIDSAIGMPRRMSTKSSANSREMIIAGAAPAARF
jgi:hypothetical protein